VTYLDTLIELGYRGAGRVAPGRNATPTSVIRRNGVLADRKAARAMTERERYRRWCAFVGIQP